MTGWICVEREAQNDRPDCIASDRASRLTLELLDEYPREICEARIEIYRQYRI